MIKLASILISALAVLFVSLFSTPENEITITSSVADHPVAGSDCIVRITLTKGDASGYARLQQILPQGLKATPIETKGAEFGMEDNVVKFVWNDLPDENTFTVSYSMQTEPKSAGTVSVPGAFFYSEGDQPVQIDLTPLQLDFSSPEFAGGEVERKIVAVTPESGEYKVVLSIHRKIGEHTARFIDNIPEGYSVTDINAEGAKFMFSNQQATFFWSRLPDEPVFNISYSLNATGDEFDYPVVSGLLVYGEEGESKFNDTPEPVIVSPEAVTDVNRNQPAEQIADNLIIQEKEKSIVQNLSTFIPAPQKGIFYKIQIAATRKSPLRNDEYFQRMYQLDQHVDLAEYDGWRKYMIGNFDTYASASDFNQRTRTKIPDAFVVAYRNAERITVKEAMSESAKAD